MPRLVHRRRGNGQALVETIIVLFFICILFFLVLDYARLLNCKTILDYAAARCARARTVGFNDFMILKTARLGVMSVSGKCLTQFDDEDPDAQPSTEMLRNRMGSYLQTSFISETPGILDFELWRPDKLGWSCVESHGDSGDISMHVWQRQPLFSTLNPPESDERDDAAEVMLHGNAKMESHYPFYLK